MIIKIKYFSILLTGTFFLAIGSLPVQASDPAELHRSQCISCHAKMTGGDGSLIYKRDDRIVTTKSELQQRVAYCAQGAHTDWNDNEITAVSNYLNELIYQFP